MVQPSPRPDPSSLVEHVRPLLAADEAVWAVVPGSQAIVATDRRLFFVAHGRAQPRPLSDFEGVRRERETTVVFIPRAAAPAVALEVDPDDEDALQALTVVGLLVACEGRLRGAP